MSTFLEEGMGNLNALVYELEQKEIVDNSTINESKVSFLVDKVVEEGGVYNTSSQQIFNSLNAAEKRMFTGKYETIKSLISNPEYAYSLNTSDTMYEHHYTKNMTDSEYRLMFDELDQIEEYLLQVDDSGFTVDDMTVDMNTLNLLIDRRKGLATKELEMHNAWIEGEGAKNKWSGAKKGGAFGFLADIARMTQVPFYFIADQVENIKYLLPEHSWSDPDNKDFPLWEVAGYVSNDAYKNTEEYAILKEEEEVLVDEIAEQQKKMEDRYGADMATNLVKAQQLSKAISDNGYVHYKYLDDEAALDMVDNYDMNYNEDKKLYELSKVIKSNNTKTGFTDMLDNF